MSSRVRRTSKEKTEVDQRKRKSTLERKERRRRETLSFGGGHGPSGRTIFYYGIYPPVALPNEDGRFSGAEVGSLINER
jgi:hypothetical protein